MKQLSKLINPKKKGVNDDEEMEDDIEEKEYIDESEGANWIITYFARKITKTNS